jgi:hypothetical protein
MQVDRTTKLLLLAIALGLWALTFAVFLSPPPAVAQAGPVPVNIAEIGGRTVTRGQVPVTGAALQVWPVEIKVVQ